jgi:glycosyltransferase involved in cell wall biosynthesis
MAAINTHEALLQSNVRSRIIFLKEGLSNNPSITSLNSSKIRYKLSRFLNTALEIILSKGFVKKGYGIFSLGLFGVKLKRHAWLRWADVIHIHWANYGLIDISEINDWGKPVVWTLRDMWAFTGGCHYSLDCTQYKNECNTCPMLRGGVRQHVSKYLFSRKYQYLNNSNITWVAVSQHMKINADSSTILSGALIKMIPSGVNCSDYKIIDKNEARLALNLPLDKKIILIGATNIRDTYKGFEYIKSSLQKLSPEIVVLTFGGGGLLGSEAPQKKIVNLGFVDRVEKLNLIYCAADLFLAPSVNEAFGKTFVEAQASGLPVVCFANTGPEEIIEHLKTGYLAKYKSEEDLLMGIGWVISHEFNKIYMRERVINLFDIKKIAELYNELYQKLTNQSKALNFEE